MNKAWHGLATSALAAWERCPSALRRMILRRFLNGFCERMGSSSKPSVFFLPLISWYHAGFQRPQQMAQALAQLGCPVLYHEPVTPDSTDVRNLEERRRRVGLEDIAPSLCLVRCPRFMIKDLLRFRPPSFTIISWPWQTRWFLEECKSLVAYEMIDDHSLLTDGDGTQQRLHERWVRDADVVIASADRLFQTLQVSRKDALLIPNGVRLEDWQLSRPIFVPDDLACARRAKVVVGYVGAISSWFDWTLWETMARRQPEWAFVIIGFAWDEAGRLLVEKASTLPNIHYLGPKPHSELKRYITHFDVATIPFQLNPITHSCSPLKLFEYMACGKPIVCTPLQEILKYKSVRFGTNAQEFVLQIEGALAGRDDLGFRKLLQEETSANTWAARGGLLLARLEDVLRQQGGIPRRLK